MGWAIKEVQQMIKLTSSIQAEQHKGQIPAIAALRMKQLEGEDGLYSPEAHGFVILVTEQDNVETDFLELGDQGLLSGTEDWPLFDYVEKHQEGTGYVVEAVTHLNNEKVLAFIIPVEPWLDPRLRVILERAAANH
jgi:hypothetical protein